ncbi:Alpha/beta-hydrolase superfamily protein [Croceitalea dokdonensis DOKDO 023]|uniref:Alpha/beta-hydrolase superfamily protein n=1 Tax=Croceitalea dokdonensis DOKDO 023 TaxID=1300341 RepID=A0A0P7AIQ8_9FLAO|nr:hypothetical protein [Croceitalea dokdonensis]KPM33477.1 Alpha/beta-hydrolase superfamily protein [Croceitalea dokdonensis DOKDO 023]
MKLLFKLFAALFFAMFGSECFPQQILENYLPAKKDSLRVGLGENDFSPFIQPGYTLMLPETNEIKGVLILLEDSKYDQKNRSAKQLYAQASGKGFAVLSVSTEVPVDFYFSNASMLLAHQLIKKVFETYDLPNQNIFFLGASLVGHRAMRYLKFIAESKPEFRLHVKGIVACNFTMDFSRKWHQHQRDIRIGKIDLWEPTFINYLLETNLGGTPKTHPESYQHFSAYSYPSDTNKNIHLYQEYAFRVYVEPAIEYKLDKQLRTLYENNTTDMVGFLAELRLVGNKKNQLIVIAPEDNTAQPRNTQSTWDAINKEDLLDWILEQTKE